MKGVIYARYSSDNQKEESIEGQLRENRAFAEKNGITIIETYIDRAYSARSDNRPEFQRMIKESARKNYDVVIVWKLDRFSRSRYDSAKYKAILKKNNKKVVSATEAISEDAEGIILESVLEGMAEYYSADLAQKVTRGMTENALKQKYNGGRSVPFGYVIDSDRKYQIDTVNAPIVRDIFERYADGERACDIIRRLNDNGICTSRGTPFNKNSFQNMISNRIYIGEYHFGDIVTPGGVPAIISTEIFEKANGRKKLNRHSAPSYKAKEKYILTTKLFCGECESMMVGESAKKKETTYRYYKCVGAKQHHCGLKPVRKEQIEDFVIKMAIKSISDKRTVDRIIQRILSMLNEENAVIPALEHKLEDVRKAKNNIVSAIEQGAFSKTLQARLTELESQEEELLDSIEKERFSGLSVSEEQIRFMLERYAYLDISKEENRQMIVDSLIGRVLLFGDGRLVITFTYRKEPVTATLEEIISESNQFGCCFNRFTNKSEYVRIRIYYLGKVLSIHTFCSKMLKTVVFSIFLFFFGKRPFICRQDPFDEYKNSDRK